LPDIAGVKRMWSTQWLPIHQMHNRQVMGIHSFYKWIAIGPTSQMAGEGFRWLPVDGQPRCPSGFWSFSDCRESAPNLMWARPSACKAPATQTLGSNFKRGVHLERSLREQKDRATLFQCTMFPVESGVECLLPKHKDHRIKVYRRTFQSWRSGHRQAVWKLLLRFCMLSPQILLWYLF
jgi:hypothetical protein